MMNRSEFLATLIRRARDEGEEDPWDMADRVLQLWASEAVPELGPEPDEDEVFAVALALEDGHRKFETPES